MQQEIDPLSFNFASLLFWFSVSSADQYLA